MSGKFFVTFVLIIAIVLLSATACGLNNTPEQTPDIQQTVMYDREGNPIVLPDSIERVISMGPSITEILVELGFADKIVAIDEFSNNIPGLSQGLPIFDMMTPDSERIIDLSPDLLFVSGLSRYGGADDSLSLIASVGITIVFIPTSESLEGIMDDITFIGMVMGAYERAQGIAEMMQQEINTISAIGYGIGDRRTVYFEVSPAPFLVSFGYGVFLNEVIELIGAENVLSDLDGWISISDEIILAANPDVILTSVDFIDEPIEEIISRPGWDALTAVREGAVHYIDADSSNRPSHNVVLAMREMARAVYPEYY